MQTEQTVSLLHALQLGGLLPCLFIVVLLPILARSPQRTLIPVAFFLCLSASFMPALYAVTQIKIEHFDVMLLLVETLQPGFAFLLMMQFLMGRPPKAVYWLILALPIIGGSSIVYSSTLVDELCVYESYCMTTLSIRTLYNVFAACLVLLLLMANAGNADAPHQPDQLRRHKYWLMIAFVVLYLALLTLDLAMLADEIALKRHAVTTTVIRIGFIYLVLTSLFRLFDQSQTFGVGKVTTATREKPVAPELIAQIEAAMRDQQLYREMGFSRDVLAKHLGVGEHVVSKAINQHYGKNLNEFVNGYRIAEAKQRLGSETTPITAIAFEVGFSSIASFNRVFKTLAGCSPSEYRAAQQENA